MTEKPQSKFNADALSPEEILALKELERRNRNTGAVGLKTSDFMAERGHWPNGQGKVRVVMLEPGNPEREAALRLIYDMNEKGFTSYFLGKKFRGETLEEPRQQSSPTDVIKFISYVPGAIGCVAAGEVDASVKVVRVDGLAPGDPGYKLRL